MKMKIDFKIIATKTVYKLVKIQYYYKLEINL